ncbi:MAG TPA: cell division protein ZapE [Rhizomicrobium sp.]|nr:cell division protein ZapE [Rhizomicrobium sp.]
MPELIERYRAGVATGEIRKDTAQEAAAQRLQRLTTELKHYKPGKRGFFFAAKPAPCGLYIWGDVGRGKSMLMDLFFELAPVEKRTRVHFNAFMVDVHARIHAEREKGEHPDPIPPVAKAIADNATLFCFDEFQVTDVADAMILGRLFQQLFERGVVIVATSNTPPDRLYEGGLNRQLFLPFIALIEERLDVLELDGTQDYRRERMSGLDIYITPLGPQADAKMDAAWQLLTDTERGQPKTLSFLGRKLVVPQAAKHVARFTFDDLCVRALAAPDYLEIARHFHTVLIDHIPQINETMRNEARRFTLLIDTLYDDGVKLICSAAAPPDRLYPAGDGAEAFRRTASRLIEMQSEEYLARGHGVHGAG